MGTILGGLLVTTLLSLAVVLPVAAQNTKSSPVKLTIPDTTLKLQGRASPGALVTIEENGSTVGTVVADSNGSYSTTLTSQQPGLRSLEIFFVDKENIRSSISSRKISVQSQRETIIDVFLSPTITRRTPVNVQQGSIVQVNGYTVANATVTLSYGIVGSEIITSSNNSGFYEFLLDTNALDVGKYSIFTVADVAGSLTLSEDSSKVSSNVIDIPTTGPSAPGKPSRGDIPDIVVSPEQLPPPIPLTPDDGATINGNSVTITGESLPNAQIVIYENGNIIGSVFSDDSGRWSFDYTATLTPVTLTFETCRDGVCSVLSRTLTLNFTNIDTTVCTQEAVVFELQEYRFWGLNTRNNVELNVLLTSNDGILYVDWGDGSNEERFDHDEDRPTPYMHKYEPGQYNGIIRYSQGECEQIRYFSVDMSKITNNEDRYWLMALIILAILPFSYYAYARGKDLHPEEEK